MRHVFFILNYLLWSSYTQVLNLLTKRTWPSKAEIRRNILRTELIIKHNNTLGKNKTIYTSNY